MRLFDLFLNPSFFKDSAFGGEFNFKVNACVADCKYRMGRAPFCVLDRYSETVLDKGFVYLFIV